MIMAQYFISILSISLFLAMVDLLLLKTQNAKLVRSIISLILITVLIVPIINIIESNDFGDNNYSLELEEQLILIEKETLTSKIKNVLDSNNVIYDSLSVEISTEDNKYQIKKVIIYLSQVINDENERININEKIKNLISSLISDKEKIQIEYPN